MAVAIILPLVTSILGKLASSPFAYDFVTQEIKGAKSVKKDLKIIADELEAIKSVLEDAEERQFTNKSIQIWIRDLKTVAYQIDDLLDKVAFHALEHKLDVVSWHQRLHRYFTFRIVLSHKIRKMRENLEAIVTKKNYYSLTERPVEMLSYNVRDPLDTCAHVHPPAIIGRDETKREIIHKLLDASDANCPFVFPIVGMGGMGKTALAKLVYQNMVQFDIKLWACVSDKFQLPQIIETILKDAGQDLTSNQSVGILVKRLKDLLDGKRYLLVLDDVWNEDIQKWLELKNMLADGKVGSVVLVTTRNSKVANVVTETIEPSYRLDKLSDSVCWSIFKRLVFKRGEEEMYPNLVQIGKSIVKKCCGIPLVVQSLGSFLRSERDEQEWRRICDLDSFVGLHGEYDDKVLQLLKLSYHKLPTHLKPCFSYLSIQLKDTELFSWGISYFWSALGLLQVGDKDHVIERTGYMYLMDLLSRSLLQEPHLHIAGIDFRSKMHDLVHDLGLSILGEELAIVTTDNLTISEYTRHIVWGYEGIESLAEKKFPTELSKFHNIRTFKFGYRMHQISQSVLEGIISNFKCLRILELQYSWFRELPRSIGNLKHLRYLDLGHNLHLRLLPNAICKLLNLETLSLGGCLTLKELPRYFSQLCNLKKLRVTTYQRSLAGTKFNELSSLQDLLFMFCWELESLWDDSKIGHLTSLKILEIRDCPKLKNLPNSMKFLIGLEELYIVNCPELDIENEDVFFGLKNLRLLEISKLPKLNFLSQGIKSATTSLQYLLIDNCLGLVQLPDCLQQFSSLRKICISKCPKLLSIPEGLYHLKSHPELIFV